MSIIKFPYNESLPEEITCIFCKRKISPSEATLGPIDTQGKPSLLCNGHLWDDRKLIDELIDYLTEERRKFFSAHGHNLMRFGASPHVRTLY